MDSVSPAAGASPSRSTAGDDSRSACTGRNTQIAPSPACASTCSRRSTPGRAWSSHSSTPPKAWLRTICSAAHSRSDGLAARTQTTCSGEKSQPTSRTALGR